MRIDKRRFYHLDWYLILNGLFIFGIGMMNLLSATSSFSSGSWNFIIKQLIAFAIGLGLMLIVMYYDYRMIADHSKWIYTGGIALVVLVLVIGLAAGGAKRWISIFGFSIQPSELMKPILVVFLANMLYDKKRQNVPLSLKDIAKPLFWTLLPFVLIVKQPDLGTGIVIILVSFCHAVVRRPQKIDLCRHLWCWGHIAFFRLALPHETVSKNACLKLYQYRCRSRRVRLSCKAGHNRGRFGEISRQGFYGRDAAQTAVHTRAPYRLHLYRFQ